MSGRIEFSLRGGWHFRQRWKTWKRSQLRRSGAIWLGCLWSVSLLLLITRWTPLHSIGQKNKIIKYKLKTKSVWICSCSELQPCKQNMLHECHNKTTTCYSDYNMLHGYHNKRITINMQFTKNKQKNKKKGQKSVHWIIQKSNFVRVIIWSLKPILTWRT